jgi:hypothetical protein
VLASGFDTVHLGFDVAWSDTGLLVVLGELKSKAAGDDAAESLILSVGDGSESVVVSVEPYGVRGYEWVLKNADVSMRVGNWLTPQARPSVIVEVRSEALWRMGPRAAVLLCWSILAGRGGQVQRCKPSRVDPCVDVLLPEGLWRPQLLEWAITRGRRSDTYRDGDNLTGFAVGAGELRARLYDKPAEIRAKSQKQWMFDVWGLQGVPAGRRIVRVEFQLRRDALRELGVLTADDVFAKEGRLWAYCTERWLRLADRPGQHVSRRRTLPWWEVVQRGYRGAQPGEALVREGAVRGAREQLLAQAVGMLTSLVALEAARHGALDVSSEYVAGAMQRVALEAAEAVRLGGGSAKVVRRKMGRYQRAWLWDRGPGEKASVVDVGPDEPCPF